MYTRIMDGIFFIHSSGKEIKMSSPDGKYQVTLSDEGGNLHYSVNWNHKEAIKPSLLGINANVVWRDQLALGDITTAEQDTVWHPVYGERSTIKDRYKAWSVVINRQHSRENWFWMCVHTMKVSHSVIGFPVDNI